VTVPPFLRNLVADLLEKRLWPVALILVAALVAVPLTLGRTGEQPAPPIPAGASAEEKAAFAAYTGVDTKRTKSGANRNPFMQPGCPCPIEDPNASSSPVGDTKSGDPTGGGSTGGAGVDASTTSTSSPSAVAAQARAPGRPRSRRPTPRRPGASTSASARTAS
jgi:hypothetical protein